MMKNLNNLFLAVGFLLPQFLDLDINLLQLLSPEPHIINLGFIRSLIGKLNLGNSPKTPELWQSIDSVD